MTLSTEVKKLTESKPFYAVAGFGDYAVEKLRELPEQLTKLQGRREELAKDLPGKARAYSDKAEVLAREFPGKAREYADQLGHKATEVYEEFASRGRKVVSKAGHELEQSAEPTPVRTPASASTTAKKPRSTKASTKA